MAETEGKIERLRRLYAESHLEAGIKLVDISPEKASEFLFYAYSVYKAIGDRAGMARCQEYIDTKDLESLSEDYGAVMAVKIKETAERTDFSFLTDAQVKYMIKQSISGCELRERSGEKN